MYAVILYLLQLANVKIQLLCEIQLLCVVSNLREELKNICRV